MNISVSQIKWTSIAIKIVSALMLFCIFMAGIKSSQATVSVTAPTLNIATPTFPSAYFALGNIVITEGANGDFPIAARNTDYTFTITAPARFEFQAGTGTVSSNSGDITTISMNVTATTITVTYRSSQANGNRQDQIDIITISGLQVRAITGTATQSATKTASSETIAGLSNGTVMANFTSTLGCTHTVTLTDTWGDGWNGGTITVSVNGTAVLSNIALSGGSGPENHTFTAADGDLINVTCTNEGSYPSEMRVAITGGSSFVVMPAQQPENAPGTTVRACCTPTVPNNATYNSPANAATNQNVCGVTLRWTAPPDNGCNGATSYDVYFGTSATPSFAINTTGTSYTTSFLLPGTTYYWKIVPKNNKGDATGAATWSFTTSATSPVPGSASNFSPADGATNQNNCGILLTWNEPAVTDCNAATSYDVYFGTSSTPPLVANVTGTSYSTGALSTNTLYYWKVVPKNSFGSASSSSTISFRTSNTTCTTCQHTLRIRDTYGDGWSGGTVNVTVNGVAAFAAPGVTLAGNGVIPEDFYFNAYDGATIKVIRTNDGSWPSEMRYTVLGASGVVIMNDLNPIPAGHSMLGCCSPTTPSCASNPSPANGAANINPCSADFSWTAPASTGCNAHNSFDFYIGTTSNPPFFANVTGTTYSIPIALADNTTYYWKVVPKNSVGGATGCSVWSFTTATSPNPNYCLYGNSINFPSAGQNCAQLTSGSPSQNGCAWNRGTISFASPFDYSILMYFGNNNAGADGCAFIFQNSPQGISQCGNNGGQLGAGGISNSVIVEFDTYDNDNPWHNYDMAEDHTAVVINGNPQSTPQCGPVQANPVSAYLTDGNMHALRVTWDPATKNLCVYVDNNQRLCCAYDYVNNVFGGNPNVWWGFSGATGDQANQQYFCPITIPLPVEMMQFSAICENGTPLLTWYTASETNNKHFIIERSEDGHTFDSIAKVNGAGNTNEIIMYQFLDNTSNSTDVYYRLRQIDFDGRNTELGIVSTQCDPKSVLEVNAVKINEESSFTLNFSTSFSGDHIISLLDVNGRLVEQKIINCSSGVNEIDFCTIPQHGIYLVKISNTQKVVSHKCKL